MNVVTKKIKSFGASTIEMVDLWKIYCRSMLEQSAVVLGPSLTEQNTSDLERTLKSFATLILQNQYHNYEEALDKLNLQTLEDRRQLLMSRLANSCIKNKKFTHLFEENNIDKTKTRNHKNTKFHSKIQAECNIQA